MVLKEAVEKFIDNITVTDKQTDVIDGAYSNIESKLTCDDCTLSVKEVFLNGSYVRDTMIRPLEDIDIFAVIDKSDYSDTYDRPNPQSVLTKFKTYLESQDDYKGKTSQSRPCITITLDKIKIDVLPALREYGSLYIPNESLDGWIITCPKAHTDELNRIDSLRNGKVKDVVKAVKSWKKQNGIKIPSFHVEEIACQIFSYTSIRDIDQAIIDWFDSAHLYIKKDRFNTENQFSDAKSAIEKISDKLDEAKECDNESALKIWHEIFGRDFPVISEEEAKKMSNLLSSGKLKYAAATGLSATIGHSVAASSGFYGEE